MRVLRKKNAAAVVRQTPREKLKYVKKNWQLYVFFLLPGLLLTLIFKYGPMGGILIAFEDYNVIEGVLGSPWVGLEYFQRFLSSPDFMNYLMNTLKLSVFGLLWGFPIPIILALLLNQIRRTGIRKKIQLLIYAPNFISVIVLCGMVRMFQEGVCWTELFQRDLCDHDVLRRRDDPHVHPDQQPAHGQYDLGDPPSGRVQRVEHDPRKDLFPVDPGRTQRGVLAGRGERDPAFL